MTYEEVVDQINQIRRFGNLAGVEVAGRMLKALGSPQAGIPLIHIAGTNGKGSVSAFLCAILREAGLRVGMFTSPHLVDFRERIQINGEMISKEDTQRIGVQLLAMDFGVQPTMFDVTLAMAILYFKEQRCDVMILETGLGGRLDATNAVGVPDVTVITKIGYDHMAVLGNTLAEIAAEKTGIIKKGTSLVLESQEAEVMTVFEAKVREEGIIDFRLIDPLEIKEQTYRDGRQYFSFGAYRDLSMRMLGVHQYENAIAALLGAEAFFRRHTEWICGGTKEREEGVRRAVCQGIAKTVWKGRMEILSKKPFLLVDGALVERTGRPVIVVTVDEHGECKGSGRSVQGFNLHDCIGSCADLLIRYGGHAMAAGLSVREENLPALRRRLNEWAARECPVLLTPPLECDLSIHLDRITVESVRRLEQLAPYGAENPTPVFVLEKAVIDGIYPVSEGRHCRLRLRQGNASMYAVWFGMHPEQLPYAMGDVVDAALNLSVYDAPRGAQLSGRILELHPAGLGNAAAEQTALVQALRRGTPLTAEQKAAVTPKRSDIITVYRELQARRWHAEDLQPLFAKLGEQNTGKILVALTALEQVGLIAVQECGGAKFWELVPAQGKKNLADAPILKCLEEE